MANEKQYLSRSAFIAIAVHVLIFALFIIGFEMRPESSQALVDPVNIVEAEVIDGQAIEDEQRRLHEEKEARERKRREEELRKKREAEEKKRQQEEARKKAEQQRLAEIKKAEEEKRLAEEQRKQAEEAKKQAELERQKAEEDARKLAEQLKKQEQARKQAELQAEQERLDAILEQEEAELREAEETAQRAARQRELNTLLSQYVGAIKSKIQSRWRKPPSVETANASCVVYVEQSVGGYIQKVEVQKCRGGDEQFRKSVEEAVWKSDPLPNPPDDELFSRQLKITFDPP